MKRSTRQQEAILLSLKKYDRPLSIDEIFEYASKVVDSINLSTIYRNLKTLMTENKVQKVDFPGDNSRYELYSLGHHHYFHCDDCLKVYRLNACPGRLETLLPVGFYLKAHSLTLNGTCADCFK